jgi:hypothetical protein
LVRPRNRVIASCIEIVSGTVVILRSNGMAIEGKSAATVMDDYV